ncbi:hypothetical protein KKG31_05100 [Patescibacteria group bacterium]|nr:hypothetical protein [Patescibacteria group bacterium]MBU1758500.1 hypothetical protein [Patescibacteria group bacterium]
MFELIIHINSIPMQDHYLRLLAEQFNLAYEVLYPQYKQYAKKEGQFFLRQKQPSKEAKYQTDRKELLVALFHDNFINNYMLTPTLRSPIVELVNKLKSIDGQTQELESQIDIPSLQLRREKEFE